MSGELTGAAPVEIMSTPANPGPPPVGNSSTPENPGPAPADEFVPPLEPPRVIHREWGSDKRVDPLPAVAPPASDMSMALGRLGIVFTILAWLAYVFSSFFTEIINNGYQGNVQYLWETIGYVLITSSLALSALLYLVARQGALYRSRAHRRVPRAVIDESFETALPTMTVLVPSYREEVAIVRMTLLSAALQEYPYLRIVLLLDDPPNPTAPEHIESLRQGRELAAELTEWLAEPRDRFAATLEKFEISAAPDTPPSIGEITTLSAEYSWAADWLRKRMDEETIVDHVDRFFADRVLGVLAADFAEVSTALATAATSGGVIPRARMLQLHRR